MFPLELTPLELLFFYDNRQQRPANFIIQLDLSGVAQKTLLEEAFGLACQQHPLLCATVARGPGRKWFWQESRQGPEIMWTGPEDVIDLEGNEKIDLRERNGLRVWAICDESKTQLILEFNHAATDGIGAYRFIGDWLAAYHAICKGEDGRQGLSDVDSERLPLRFQRLHQEVKQRNWFSRFGIAFREGLDYVGPPVNRIHPRRREKSKSVPRFPGMVSRSFSADEHQQLKQAAMENGFSMNDLLISELFLTIADWNLQHPAWSWSWRKRIRLSLPTDMRDQSDYATSASNMTALVFLTRHLKNLQDPAQLKSSVREEILKIRNTRKGIDNLILLDILTSMPFPALWMSTRAKCCYSAVISNIGDPTRRMLNRFEKNQRRLVVGNMQLELVTGVPPMRPDTNAAVSIFTYRRLLTISLRCDPLLFDLSDTGELMDLYVERLKSNLRSPQS